MMAKAMRDGFPLRGAIGGGDFYKDGEVMVSTALADAARYEKEQEWLGAVLTPDALNIIETAKKFEKRQKGETRIEFSSERFNYYVRYGAIPWKKEGRLSERPAKTFYIKPFEMADNDWSSKYLPTYFNDPEKVINSHSLYGEK